MTPVQKYELRLSDLKGKLADLLAGDEPDAEAVRAVTLEIREADSNRIAAMLLDPEPPPTIITHQDNKLLELRERVDFTRYVRGAIAAVPVVGGAEAEYNAELAIPDGYFPLDLLTRDLEQRAARDGDGMASQATWLDYLFAASAAERVGITFRSVAPGTATFPVMSAAADGVQRARAEAVAEGTYTVGITEAKPKRNAVLGVYSIEDESRLPGLADSMIRNMREGLASAVDKACFVGDAGATGTDADIAGLTTATGVVESTITQVNKVKGDELLKVFLAWVDGISAQTMQDLRAVVSVGSNVLWGGATHAAAVDNETVAQYLRANGVTWVTRAGIDTATANGDFGAFVGLGRGIEGAGVACVWNQGRLVRDEFTGKAKGEVELSLDYQWDLQFPRGGNFKRLKYVG